MKSRLELINRVINTNQHFYADVNADVTAPHGQGENKVTASKDDDLDTGRGLDVVEEVSKPELKRPPMYKVVLLNDDYTPMEFVIEVLQMFFSMNREKATQVMLAVHTTGRATCGIFTRDIAETKSAQVNQYAQDNQHPLVSEIEAAD